MIPCATCTGVHYIRREHIFLVLYMSRREFHLKMTQTQQEQMINKIYELVDSHYPSPNLNDVLIEELCMAFEQIMGEPVTV